MEFNKKITCSLAQRGIGIENAGHVKVCNLSTHIFKDANGDPYRIDQTNLRDIWNNNVTRKEINDSLDKGERHENCQLCWDAVLINSAIALAKKPILMATSFKNAVIAGRQSFLAGRMKKSFNASASSPESGLI